MFGRMPDGTAVEQFTLCNQNRMTVKIISYGAIVTEIQAPDRDGNTVSTMQPTPPAAAVRISRTTLSTSSVADGRSGPIRIDKCSWNRVTPLMASGLISPL